MFLLPNGNKIDEDGLQAAFSDISGEVEYFLDSITGQIGEVDSRDKPRLKTLRANKRYFEIPKVSAATQLGWLKNMLEEMGVSKKLIAKVEKESAKYNGDEAAKSLRACEIVLEKDKTDEGWQHGWAQWQSDEVWHKVEDWFAALPIKIRDIFEPCDDCPACKLFAEEYNKGEE